jgi:hypothetical protein
MSTMGDAVTCNSKLNVCLRIKPTKEKNEVSLIFHYIYYFFFKMCVRSAFLLNLESVSGLCSSRQQN